MDSLPDLYRDFLPTEFMDDEMNPVNDPYIKTVERLKTQIVTFSATMTPKQVEMCKQKQCLVPCKDIAKKVNISQKRVVEFFKTVRASEMLALLSCLDVLITGPLREQRINMLWLIARNNHILDPKIAIQANAELERMEANKKSAEAGVFGGHTINIQINSELMPKTVLDG